MYDAATVVDIEKWAVVLISNNSAAPHYIIDLIENPLRILKIDQLCGFTPIWPDALGEKRALFGIAYRLKAEIYDCPVNEEEAENLLSSNPAVLMRFKTVLPWVVI